jgi:hypothetical protein
MDLSNRGNRPLHMQQPNHETANSNGHNYSSPSSSNSSGNNPFKNGMALSSGLSAVMLFSLAIVMIGLISFLVFGGGSDTKESDLVKAEKYQAVFLSGGQVYFGKITSLTNDVVTLSDIYYLRVNQQQEGQPVDANNISLAKLGNELHGPEDAMVINRDQVQFWENLKDDGQVVKAIKEYAANPDAANNQSQTQQQQNTNTTQ